RIGADPMTGHALLEDLLAFGRIASRSLTRSQADARRNQCDGRDDSGRGKGYFSDCHVSLPICFARRYGYLTTKTVNITCHNNAQLGRFVPNFRLQMPSGRHKISNSWVPVNLT